MVTLTVRKSYLVLGPLNKVHVDPLMLHEPAFPQTALYNGIRQIFYHTS